MAESDENHQREQRIVRLEEWMMHTDHLLKSLNEVVCQLQDRLDEQFRKMNALHELMRREQSPDEEERSFEDERPPHY